MSRAGLVVAASLPGRAAELRALDRAVRAARPLSARVGVVGVAPGLGCSTAAGLMASVLAARRPLPVLAVDAAGGPRSLLWHAGLTVPAPSTPADERARAAARTTSAALTGTVVTAGGLHGLELVPPGTEPSDARWWQAVAPGGRFADVVVTDWGVRDAATVPAVVAASTTVVVVAAASRTSLQRAADLAAVVTAAGVRAVVAAVDADRRRRAAVADLVRLLPVPAAELRHDPHHRATRPVPSSRLRARTLLGALRLTALAVDDAAGPAAVPTSDRAADTAADPAADPAADAAPVPVRA